MQHVNNNVHLGWCFLGSWDTYATVWRRKTSYPNTFCRSGLYSKCSIRPRHIRRMGGNMVHWVVSTVTSQQEGTGIHWVSGCVFLGTALPSKKCMFRLILNYPKVWVWEWMVGVDWEPVQGVVPCLRSICGRNRLQQTLTMPLRYKAG